MTMLFVLYSKDEISSTTSGTEVATNPEYDCLNHQTKCTCAIVPCRLSEIVILEYKMYMYIYIYSV